MFINHRKSAFYTAAFSTIMSGMLLIGGGLAAAEEAEELTPESLSPEQNQVLQSKQIDVTGDGKPDTVVLAGSKLDPSSPYFAKLALMVSGLGHNPVMIPLEGGYNPRMLFCDFNGDKLPEVYVSSETGGSGGLSNYALYSLKRNVPTAIPLPEPLRVTNKFKHNYVVKLKIEETGKSYKIDLKEKKKDYDEFGIYKNNRLVKPFIVNVNAYGALQPIDIDQDGVCELKGVQRITGIANADTIGYAKSLWKWQDGKWTLASSKVTKEL
ncbi:hypothetical protein [Paenibacillus hexagrammi]|uniref:VCBS repeat-containing protein n=1 Tax=Paenibacillus hexagrammi TaxID=2908839 RepID=A0ABY3SIF9_9BACL|nr:hypothetical protein [Paenibacillus sp. YPD9-1]UJF33514.1 hypothetical protein L0M14_29120 [Paenibacillus sp. YPD9-1]